MPSKPKNGQNQKQAKASLHETIMTDVKQKIMSGEWRPGDRIPFETDMAKHYGCSRMTVNKALSQLSNAGLLDRNKKWGTFVSAPHTVSAALQITNIRKEVEDAGKSYAYRLISDRVRPAKDREKRLLELDEGAPLRELKCLHFADDQPFCFEDRIINLSATPEIELVSFDEDSPNVWMTANVPWNSAEHQIMASAANDQIAKALNVPKGSACLIIERKTQNDKGYVTWARLAYPGNKHRLVASFTPTD